MSSVSESRTASVLPIKLYLTNGRESTVRLANMFCTKMENASGKLIPDEFSSIIRSGVINTCVSISGADRSQEVIKFFKCRKIRIILFDLFGGTEQEACF